MSAKHYFYPIGDVLEGFPSSQSRWQWGPQYYVLDPPCLQWPTSQLDPWRAVVEVATVSGRYMRSELNSRQNEVEVAFLIWISKISGRSSFQATYTLSQCIIFCEISDLIRFSHRKIFTDRARDRRRGASWEPLHQLLLAQAFREYRWIRYSLQWCHTRSLSSLHMFLDAFVSVLLSTANNVNGCERFSVSKTMCVMHTVFCCRGRERWEEGYFLLEQVRSTKSISFFDVQCVQSCCSVCLWADETRLPRTV